MATRGKSTFAGAITAIVVDVIVTTILIAFALIGWNSLGAADLLGAPHVGVWQAVGLMWVVSSLAAVAGRGARNGARYADELRDLQSH